MSTIYNTLAGYYDQLVGDPDAWDAWAQWVNDHQSEGTFLELACGSGEITRRLAVSKQVTAMDLSESMVQVAKAKDLPGLIEFHTGDMRELDGYRIYDGIGCFCDSFNYLLTKEDVQSFFRQIHDHLKDGGLFFFDSHAIDRLEEFEEERVETGLFEDGTQVQWEIVSEDDLIYQDFVFYLKDKEVSEHHIQKVWSPDFLMEQLQVYFEIQEILTDFDLEGIAPGEKYFFVCRKKEVQ